MEKARPACIAIVFILFSIFPSLSAANAPTLQILIADLKDPNEKVREQAARDLETLSDTGSVDALIGALEDKNQTVRYHASGALRWIRPPAFAAIQDALESSDKTVRREAAKALGLIAGKRALELLTSVTKDSEKEVRAAAVRALGLIGDESSTDLVKSAFRDKHYDVRAAAGTALNHIKFANRASQ